MVAKKVWQQRFAQPLDPRVHRLNRSIDIDGRLYPYDVQVSMAWAEALARCGLLSRDESAAIKQGLGTVLSEWDTGQFKVADEDEDIHMAIERRLGEIIGDPAKKLHTGRSRNDQVATGLRLYVMDHAGQIGQGIGQVVALLVDMAEEQAHQPFPGYTHLQQAQVLSLGQWLLAHAWSLKSDGTFLAQVKSSTAVCPLGSGALGGSTAPVDRTWIATELGFARPSENSVEAVSSRDFVMDLLYGLSRLGIHLSRLAEDFIIYSSQEFGYVSLDDSVATGSSLLAHKKNPDVFELLRGKSGRLLGDLTGFMSTVKGLPTGYNKDLQEDKAPLFDAVDSIETLWPALIVTLQRVTFHPEAVAQQISPYLKAERIVAHLSGKGLAFRDAYGIAGGLVKAAEIQGVALEDLSLDALQAASPHLDENLRTVLAEGWSVPAEGIAGGSNRASIKEQIESLRGWLKGRD